jgi:hypothetical protein
MVRRAAIRAPLPPRQVALHRNTVQVSLLYLSTFLQFEAHVVDLSRWTVLQESCTSCSSRDTNASFAHCSDLHPCFEMRKVCSPCAAHFIVLMFFHCIALSSQRVTYYCQLCNSSQPDLSWNPPGHQCGFIRCLSPFSGSLGAGAHWGTSTRHCSSRCGSAHTRCCNSSRAHFLISYNPV